MEAVEALRFAIRQPPPALILEYVVPSTKKRRQLVLRLDGSGALVESAAADVADEIQRALPPFMNTTHARCRPQIERLVRQLQSRLRSDAGKAAEAAAAAAAGGSGVNLNAVSPGHLARAKAEMDTQFEKNRASQPFVYDVRDDFDGAKDENDWDESESD